MLAGEQGGRRDHRNLLAVHRRDERGAQRDLGLAEADVAAHQPVHRLAFGEVARARPRSRAPGRRSPPTGSGRRTGAKALSSGSSTGAWRSARAAAVRSSSLAISRMRSLSRALRRCQPSPPSRSSAAPSSHAAVAAEHVDVLDRDVELVAPGILEHHAVVLALADGDRLEPEVLADAVVEVDHEVAAVERRQLGEEGVGVLAPLAPADEPVAEQVLLGDQVELVVGEAGVERQDHRHRAPFADRPSASCQLSASFSVRRRLPRGSRRCGCASLRE